MLHMEASVLESVSEKQVDCRKLKRRENYVDGRNRAFCGAMPTGVFWLTMLV